MYHHSVHYQQFNTIHKVTDKDDEQIVNYVNCHTSESQQKVQTTFLFRQFVQYILSIDWQITVDAHLSQTIQARLTHRAPQVLFSRRSVENERSAVADVRGRIRNSCSRIWICGKGRAPEILQLV